MTREELVSRLVAAGASDADISRVREAATIDDAIAVAREVLGGEDPERLFGDRIVEAAGPGTGEQQGPRFVAEAQPPVERVMGRLLHEARLHIERDAGLNLDELVTRLEALSVSARNADSLDDFLFALVESGDFDRQDLTEIIRNSETSISPLKEEPRNQLAEFLQYDPFTGTTAGTPQNPAQLLLVGEDGEEIQLGPGIVQGLGRIDDKGGVARLAKDAEELRALGFEPGEVVTIVVATFDEQGRPTEQSPPTKVALFPSDASSADIVAAANERGMIPPKPTRQEEQDLESELADSLDIGTDEFLGVQTADAVEVFTGRGTPEYRKPVYTAEDAEFLLTRLPPDALMDVQENMARAGLAPMTEVNGAWTPQWASRAAIVMAFANQRGYAPSASDEGKLLGFTNAVKAMEANAFRRGIGAIPDRPPTVRRKIDPTLLEQRVREFAAAEYGYDLSPKLMREFTDHLASQYEQAFRVEELVAEREWIQENVEQGLRPNAQQQQLLEDAPGEIVTPDPTARFEKHFRERLGPEIAGVERQQQRSFMRDMLGRSDRVLEQTEL